LVSSVTGLHVQRNKAIVGKNAFAHEAGIHQDGYLKNRETYEIMSPEDVGISRTELVLGKHSGRHALRERIAGLGYELNDEQLNRVFDEFKKLCDLKKEVFDADFFEVEPAAHHRQVARPPIGIAAVGDGAAGIDALDAVGPAADRRLERGSLEGFARQYADDNYSVIATARNPEEDRSGNPFGSFSGFARRHPERRR